MFDGAAVVYERNALSVRVIAVGRPGAELLVLAEHRLEAA